LKKKEVSLADLIHCESRAAAKNQLEKFELTRGQAFLIKPVVAAAIRWRIPTAASCKRSVSELP